MSSVSSAETGGAAVSKGKGGLASYFSPTTVMVLVMVCTGTLNTISAT